MITLSDDDAILDYIDNKLADFHKRRKLVPFIGSGFTKGEQALKYKVPSVDEVIKIMADLIVQHTSQFIHTDLTHLNLERISDIFYKIVSQDDKVKFLNNYFTNVHIKGSKLNFLKLGWKYIYTLNIDDAIERSIGYFAIVPYKPIRKEHLDKVVFKLHGDAKFESAYLNEDNVIFSRTQYIDSLERNSPLLTSWREDYTSRNFIFIGCSLENELDLEYALSINKLGNSIETADRIFVTTTNKNAIETFALEKLGINKLLIVRSYDWFYESVYESLSAIEYNEELMFADYLNLQIAANGDFNNDKLFITGGKQIDISKGNVIVPTFFIRRTICNEISKRLNEYPLIFVLGKRISGKTFLALQIIESIKNRDTIFIPSYVSLDVEFIDSLQQLRNTVVIFDTNTISNDLIVYISDAIDKFSERSISLLIFINSSDRVLASLSYNIVKVKDEQIYTLENKFDDNELLDFNNHITKVGFQKTQRHTLLETIINYKSEYNLWDKELTDVVNSITQEDLLILLLSASFDKVYSRVFRMLGLDFSQIQRICEKFKGAVEIEYDIKDLEISQHSAFKVLTNSKAYIFKILGTFIENNNKHIEVTDTVYHIVERLKYDYNFYEYYKGLITFDNLNQIFYKREAQGAIKLIYSIYRVLQPLLNQDYHYWTQRAKSIYRLSNDQKALYDALIYAKKPLELEGTRQRLNALLLVAQITGKIAKLDGYRDHKIVVEAINSYYGALQENSANEEVIKNFIEQAKRKGNSDDFYSIVINARGNTNFTGSENKKLTFLLTRLFKG